MTIDQIIVTVILGVIVAFILEAQIAAAVQAFRDERAVAQKAHQHLALRVRRVEEHIEDHPQVRTEVIHVRPSTASEIRLTKALRDR